MSRSRASGWSCAVRSRLAAVALFAAATLAGPLVIAGTASADLPGGCDFAPTGTTPSCLPALPGSTFAGGDGNLLANLPNGNPSPFGTTDWQNVEGLNIGEDRVSGSTDNSFCCGSSEDNPKVTVSVGSIPPSSTDLTRFYEASQFLNNQNFLYLAWQRTNNLGSADIDFELNQRPTPGFNTDFCPPPTSGCPLTLTRTPNDVLITFEFRNGGGVPVIAVKRWLPAGSTTSCFSRSAKAPCWGDNTTLTDGSNTIAAVNNLGAVLDPLRPVSPLPSGTPCSKSLPPAQFEACLFNQNPVPASRFGEVAINLTAAGVFPARTCVAFGSAFVKSRASASFSAELKDFIAPIPISISNCLNVSGGYNDNERPGSALTPWQGQVDNFVGCNQTDPATGQSSACKTEPKVLPPPSFVYDGGALLFTNTSGEVGAPQDFTLSHLSVTIGHCLFHPWKSLTPGSLTVPPGTATTPGTMILTETGFSSGANAGPWGTGGCETAATPGGYANFDTSETVPAALGPPTGPPCPADHLVPRIVYHVDQQQSYTLHDSAQILNTGGRNISSAGCGGRNETTPFVPLS